MVGVTWKNVGSLLSGTIKKVTKKFESCRMQQPMQKPPLVEVNIVH